MTIRKTAALAAILMLSASPLYAQFGGTPEQRAARAAAVTKQLALEASLPKLTATEEVLPLRVPGYTMGETEGVSMNKAGHLFVYSRTGRGGTAKGGTGAMVFEFDQNNKFVKEWLPNSYGASFAHSIRVDAEQNVWVVDEGSNTIAQVSPNGDLMKVLGRKTEAIDYLEEFVERGEKDTNLHPVGGTGTFNRPTDIAWAPNGDSFIADGYNNSRVVKIAKDGTWLKTVGSYGNGPNQFNTVHGIATDADGNVYVADRGNSRIQVYDYDLNFKESIVGLGAPWTVQTTAKYIYSGDGTGKIYQFDRKTRKQLGWFQTGLGYGQTGCLIHELHAVSDNVLIRGSCSRWDVSKITIK